MSIIRNDTTRTIMLRSEEILDERIATIFRMRHTFKSLARSAARVALSHRIERVDGTFDYPSHIIIRIPSSDWDDNPGKWGPATAAETGAAVLELLRGRGDLSARSPKITFEPDPTITRPAAGRPNKNSSIYKGTVVGGKIHDTVKEATFPHLLIESNGQRIPLLRHHEPVLAGRAAEEELRIDDESVSRYHFRATLGTDATVRISDNESLGGTWVNGARLAAGETAVLRDGDTFAAADIPIRVVIPGAPPRPRPAPSVPAAAAQPQANTTGPTVNNTTTKSDNTGEVEKVNPNLAEEIDAAWTILDDHGSIPHLAAKTGVFEDQLATSRTVREQINAGVNVPPGLVLQAVLACREAIIQIER